jgi:hypothetical protein
MIVDKFQSKKFFVLQEMVAVCLIYFIGCAVRPELVTLMPVVLTLEGVFGAYLGVQGMVDNSKVKK